MGKLENIEPARVMYYFEEIAAIPHGSKNTKAVSDYLVKFAESNGLKYRQDKLGNVVIFKDAAPGYEDKEAVILQGHMDMVLEKADNCKIDMDKEPIELVVDADVIRANGTTLGADDGIAVAMMLALLEDKELKAPKLESIFTVDEEIGMLGANAFDVSDITGHRMINLDSENEGVFTVGCAGGVVAKCVLPLKYETQSGPVIDLMISGLTGGHSGIEIDKNRANAIVLLGRCLQAVSQEYKIGIVELKGGAKDNAIPTSAKAQFIVTGIKDEEIDDVLSKVVKIVSDITPAVKSEYSTTDPKMMIACRPIFNNIRAKDSVGKYRFEAKALDIASTDKAIYMLSGMPNGIIRMSPSIPGMVQTSLNMGIVERTNWALILTYCVRSSVASEKEALMMRLKTCMKVIGGEVKFDGDYVSWEFLKDSALLQVLKEVYISQYGKEPVIETVHAGVECGIFASKIAKLDAVSIGPELKDIHTPNETMNIASVGRLFEMVKEVLARMA